MGQLDTQHSTPSTVCWQTMEEMARQHIQQWLQDLLEQEVTEFLGRARYHRRGSNDHGYRKLPDSFTHLLTQPQLWSDCFRNTASRWRPAAASGRGDHVKGARQH